MEDVADGFVVVDSSDAHTDPVHPIDVLLGFDPVLLDFKKDAPGCIDLERRWLLCDGLTLTSATLLMVLYCSCTAEMVCLDAKMCRHSFLISPVCNLPMASLR